MVVILRYSPLLELARYTLPRSADTCVTALGKREPGWLGDSNPVRRPGVRRPVLPVPRRRREG
jgi:hypothetical protein